MMNNLGSIKAGNGREFGLGIRLKNAPSETKPRNHEAERNQTTNISSLAHFGAAIRAAAAWAI